MGNQDKRQEFWYIAKKSEKLVTAVYMLTDSISDTEPIKGQLRRCALSLITDIHMLDGLHASRRRECAGRIMDRIESIISFLEIASASGIISRMNAEVLVGEFGNVKDLIGAYIAPPQSPDFTKESFTLPAPEREKMREKMEQMFQGHDSVRISDIETFTEQKKKEISARRDQIVSVLRSKPGMTIRDILKNFPGLGEKTLQRELSALITQGIIKKDGERRWSRYSSC